MGKPNDVRCICCRKKRRGRCLVCVKHTEPCRPPNDPDKRYKVEEKMNLRVISQVHED